MEWTKTSDQLNRHYMEPRCHEGNYGLAGQLIGARQDERNFAKGRTPIQSRSAQQDADRRSPSSGSEPSIRQCDFGLADRIPSVGPLQPLSPRTTSRRSTDSCCSHLLLVLRD